MKNNEQNLFQAAKLIYENSDTDKFLKAVLVQNFPELLQNVDEKIVNEILEYFTVERKRDFCSNPDRQRWINWLKSKKKKQQQPKWLYRLEYKDSSCGLWYDGNGNWCFNKGIGSLDSSCKTKSLPMEYDERYKLYGRDWFSSCSKKEDLLHWYSEEDARKLINKGFIFTRYLATEYMEYDKQTVFIRDTALCREEIDFFELMGKKKSKEWGEEDEKMYQSVYGSIEYAYGKSSKVTAWLKDLKNRFSLTLWKPTVEQLDSLSQAMERNDRCGYVLRTLYDQLKKF